MRGVVDLVVLGVREELLVLVHDFEHLFVAFLLGQSCDGRFGGVEVVERRVFHFLEVVGVVVDDHFVEFLVVEVLRLELVEARLVLHLPRRSSCFLRREVGELHGLERAAHDFRFFFVVAVVVAVDVVGATAADRPVVFPRRVAGLRA